jgi:hypothetical protein
MQFSSVCNEIALNTDVYEILGGKNTQELKRLYALGRKTFGQLWNSIIENTNEIDELEEKISVGNGELSCKSMAEIVFILQHKLPVECRLNNQSHFADLGSGYGLALMHTICQTNQTLANYSGIEVESSRLRGSRDFAQRLGYTDRVTIVQDSFNSLHNPQIYQLMSQATHFFAFDWVFSKDTLEKLAEFLIKSDTWRVFVSFRNMKIWSRYGLHRVAVCFGKLGRRRMHSQNMTAYVYLRNKNST